jgi:acyl-CoA reductase-like NAD-dependent aldehyde dehydrogenase
VSTLDPDLQALQEVRDFAERAWRACEAVHEFSQEQIDGVCAAMAEAGARAAHDLARLAVEETGIGRVHYKVLKNLFGSELTWESIKDERTVGVVARDEARGITEVATPVGVVAGIVPTTNPTSTALFKALISVKGRNAIVLSPHPRSRRCIGETAAVLRRAIERAGGPPDLVLSLSNPTIESTGALMRHPRVAVILATGGTGLVQAAYSSGKPAYGVGPGNVPVYIDRSADLEQAARAVVESQSFDNGTLCCSEQALVLDQPVADAMLAALRAFGAHLCSEEETRLLARACTLRGHMDPDVVGKDPAWIAEKAGFRVPPHTTVLLAHQGGVGRDWPLSIEILAPVLSVHLVDGWREGCRVSMETLRAEGLGHTCGVWARDERVVEAWAMEKPANRILVNGPTSQGAIGYSTHLVPSVSLGCGPQAGNITSDNISARHLVNIKRVAHVRSDWQQMRERDHERAARWTGERAPRGSGMPGDPALSGGSGPRPASAPSTPTLASAGPVSNWRGNPPLFPREPAPAPASVPATPSRPPRAAAPAAAPRPATPPPAPSGGSAVAPPARAPRFTDAARERAPQRPASPTATAAHAVAPPPAVPATARSPYVGASLSEGEIRAILSHAGSGCPLGPCQGCPHHNVQSLACEA